jgi:hypothetical protein
MVRSAAGVTNTGLIGFSIAIVRTSLCRICAAGSMPPSSRHEQSLPFGGYLRGRLRQLFGVRRYDR